MAKRYDPTEPPKTEHATANELALWLRCTPRTIKVWEAKGVIPPSVKLGRKKLWCVADVAAAIKQREVA